MTSGELIKKLEKMYSHFSASKMQYSILIDGAWGIGKTFTYNSFIKGKKNNNYYISLFGIASLKEIENEIIQKVLFPNFKKLNKNSIFNVVSKMGTQFLETKSGINFSDVISVNKLENLDFSDKSLICFDDIERVNENIDFKELLGLIERLSKKTNIIILCNKEKLSEEKIKIFNEYQEKIIDYYYYLDDIDDKFLKSLIADWKISDKSVEIIMEFFKKEGSLNLRFLEKIKALYQELTFEYKGCNWLSKNEDSILHAISYLVSEQFYGRLTEKYKKEAIALKKILSPNSSENLIENEIEKDVKENSYIEAIPYDLREIAMILNRFIKSSENIDPDMKLYFDNKIIFKELSKKIECWFLEDEVSIKKSYDEFSEKFIRNIDILNLNYQLRGFLVLRRFQNVLKDDSDLGIIKIKIKDIIKKYLKKEKRLDIYWEVQHYLISNEELTALEEIKAEAEKEFSEEESKRIKKTISGLKFDELIIGCQNEYIEDINELNLFFDQLMCGECPEEYWENLSKVLKLLTKEARYKLLEDVEKNIEHGKNFIIKTRNGYLKNIILSV